MADLIREAFEMILPRRANQTRAMGSVVPAFQNGMVQFSQNYFYERFARQGYGKNELVFACIEELCSSASEPSIAAYTGPRHDPQVLDAHPVVDLFNRPNPFLSRYMLVSGIVLYLSLAGNAYIEKVRSAAGKVVELWLLRPDRMRVIPGGDYILGYEYQIGAETFRAPARDIIHIKTNNPIDDWYGMPPLAAAMERVDSDNFMRQYIGSFFVNSGVPAGLLKIKQQLEDEDRAMLGERYRSQYGGPNGWHGLMVLDGSEVEYQALGTTPGPRGLAAPDLDEITEARIPMVFGVPLELIGARLGMIHGNRSTTKEARAGFWDETLAPLYQLIGEAITMGMMGEFPGADYFAFDLSTVKALAEDENAKSERLRAEMLAGGISREEFREATGREPAIPKAHTLMLSSGVTPWPMDEAEREPDLMDDEETDTESEDYPAGELTGAARNGRAN